MTHSRRTGLLLALATACISGVSIFVNSNGVKAYGSAAVYTTAKNIAAAIILQARDPRPVGDPRGRRRHRR